MRAAIYARRSTEEQAASLDVQVDEAKRYLDGKGWMLAPEHIYIDDAVSRAEFVKRPGLARLRSAAADGLLDVIVMRDETRLGGDMLNSTLVAKELLDAGLRIVHYATGKDVRLDDAISTFMSMAQNFSAQQEREKTSSRTREHLQNKARRGLNTGGKCYGYRNVPILEGSKRVAVDYEIEPSEAAIVLEIFRRYVAGDGLRTIAKDLNARAIPSPRGTGSWSAARIREMLIRERYIGAFVWGKAHKTYRGGTKVRVAKAESDLVRVERPELRIVPQELWDAVRARHSKRAPWKAGSAGPKPRYLLSGLARCAECGGPMAASNSKQGSEVIRVYGCSYHRGRGDSVCGNTLRRPVAGIDAAVIEWIETNVLREELVIEVIREVRARLAERAKAPNTEADELRAEGRKLRAEIDRLVAAIAAGTASPTLGQAIEQREARLSEVNARLDVLRTAPDVISLEARRLEREARKRLDDFRGLLGRNTTEARKALEALLQGPLAFTPIELPEGGKRYRIEGRASVGSVFTTEGVPNGIAHVLNAPDLPGLLLPVVLVA